MHDTTALDRNIKKAAEDVSAGEVTWECVIPITETYAGDVLWDGAVTVYNGPQGQVYAWAYEGDDGPQFIAILARPPVLTPHDAVRTWMVSTKTRR